MHDNSRIENKENVWEDLWSFTNIYDGEGDSIYKAFEVNILHHGGDRLMGPIDVNKVEKALTIMHNNKFIDLYWWEIEILQK